MVLGQIYKMKPLVYNDEMRDKYTQIGAWGKPTLADLWDYNARTYPDREAVMDSTKRMTWAQAKQWYDRLALGFLELGLKKDDVVATELPNLVESLLLIFAFEKAGILPLPAMTTFRHAEMEYLMKTVNARGVVIMPTFRNFDYYQMIQEIRPKLPKLEYIFIVGDEVPADTISIKEMGEKPLETKYPENYLQQTKISPYEVRTLRTTSGTTGLPKITEYMNAEWLVGKVDADRFKMTIDDVTIAFTPFIGGPGGGPTLWAAPHYAAKIIMMERFDAEEALQLIERERVTIAGGVPAQMTQLLAHPNLDQYDTSSLRVYFYAGAPCPYNLAKEFDERMNCKVLTGLGAVDTGRVTSLSIDDPPEVRWRSVGKTYPGNEVKLVDDNGNEVPPGEEGEIVWRGPTLLANYYRDVNATLEIREGKIDGFVATGDLGKLDEQGNLYVVGRKKDIIIRGGQNISPLEIENLLITHPKVSNVTIVPMPDPVMGEKACAFIIPKEGTKFTFDEMVSFLKEQQIAPYKLPERLEIVKEFPVSGHGQKILKRQLTAEVTEKLKAEGKI